MVSTPCCRTAFIFWASPPIGPTSPSSDISPVIAMSRPPVSSPGVSSSIKASVKARPADGPPITPVSNPTSNGRSTVERLERTESDDGALRVVRRRRQLDGHLEQTHVGTIDQQVDCVARLLAFQCLAEIGDGEQRDPVGFEQRVGRIDLLVAREEFVARAVVGGDEAEHVFHDDLAEVDLGLVAGGTQGHELCPLGCAAHLLQYRGPDAAPVSGRRTCPLR